MRKKNNYLMLMTLCCMLMAPVMGQDEAQDNDPVQIESVDNNAIDNKQKEIEDLYVTIYKINEKYPEMTYQYKNADDGTTVVKIEGVSDANDQKKLETCFINLYNIKKQLKNLASTEGIYLVAETEPKPKMGIENFYQQLHSNLSYPESALDMGVEGTIYVKFVVNENGEVGNVVIAEDIDAPVEAAIDDFKAEAKSAIESTSGQWEPSTVGGVPVSQWMVLPVQFKLESPHFIPIY